MHRFDPGNLVLTPDGVGTVQFYREGEKTYGVQLNTTIKHVYLYPAQKVCSIDGKLQALRDMLGRICQEATIDNGLGYLPSSIASLIDAANKLLQENE